MALPGTAMPSVALEWSRTWAGGQWKQPPLCLRLCCVIYVVTQTKTSTWKPPKLHFSSGAADRAQPGLGMFWVEAVELNQDEWEMGQ